MGSTDEPTIPEVLEAPATSTEMWDIAAAMVADLGALARKYYHTCMPGVAALASPLTNDPESFPHIAEPPEQCA